MTMSQDGKESNLYWTGGQFRVSLLCLIGRSRDEVDQALIILEEFRSACQRQFIGFNGVVNGRHLALQRLSSALSPEHRDKAFLVGTGPPDGEQVPGRSTIASIPQGELLEGLQKGGEFESLHAKALIVFIYHLWEEYFRARIADVLHVEKKKVCCDLMGDVRQIRNAIVHDNSMVTADDLSKFHFLPGIWQVGVGHLDLTETMLHSLMEQINAIRVDIVP